MAGNFTNLTTENPFVTPSTTTYSNISSTGVYFTTVTPIEQEDLVWILPAFLGIICFLFGVACVLFHTIKQCEICIIRLLHKHCGCCPAPTEYRETRTRRNYSELKEREDINDEIDAMYMKDLVGSTSSLGTLGRTEDTTPLH